MTPDSPYVIGHFSKKPSPLARFLPPIPEGIAKSWLQSHLAGSNHESRPWILDPFGSSPHLIREISESGYRVLVAANNPIIRFIIEMMANPPKESQLRSALSELAASYRGEERMEPHIKSLYETECVGCKKNIQADAFLWERGETSPYARIYTCPFCGDSGEQPADAALAWLLHNPVVTAPIIGPRTLEQLTGSLRALEIKLDQAALKVLDEIFPGPGGEAPEAYAW